MRQTTAVLVGWCALWYLGNVAGPSLGPAHFACGTATVRISQAVPAVAVLFGGWPGVILASLGGWSGGRAQGLRTEADLVARPYARALAPDAPSSYCEVTTGAVVRITGWPRVAGRRWRAPGLVAAVGTPREARSLEPPGVGSGVMISAAGRQPAPGALLAGAFRWRAASRARYEAGFDQAAFLAGRGIGWRGTSRDSLVVVGRRDPLARLGASCLAPLRSAIAGRLEEGFPPREAALLGSVLLGRKQRDDGVPRKAFGALGLAHLFAVSGLHVGIVAGVLLVVVRPLGLGPTGRWLLISLGLGLYVLLTGSASSTVRAAAMASGAMLAPVAGRRHDLPRLLALIFWATQVWSPASAADTGLRLSFLAVSGILVAGVRAWRPGRAAVRWLAAGLAVSLGAQCFTAPEVVRSFGWMSPWAPLVNLAAVPLFGLAVWGAVAGMALGFLPWVGDGLAAWSWGLLRGLEGGAALLSGAAGPPPGMMPWSPLRWLGWLALIGGWILLRGPLRLLAVALLIVLPFLPTRTGVTMRVLQADVGQGDAAAFLFPDGSAVLVDTGECWEGGGAPVLRGLVPWLRRQGVRELAGVALTHRHADHDGAAGEVAAEIPVGTWWLGGRCEVPEQAAGAPRTTPAPGDTLHAVGSWALVCLWNGAWSEAEHENDRSLALGLLRNGALEGLWTGDLELEGESGLISAMDDGFSETCAVFKAGHHGSRTSAGPQLLNRMRPSTVLISVGIASRHGHPSHGPYFVESDTLPVFRTDLQGSLLVEWAAGKPPEIVPALSIQP